MGGGGQCYQTCDAGLGCVYDMQCMQPDGVTSEICVPAQMDAGTDAEDDVDLSDVIPPDDAGDDVVDQDAAVTD
jgi:hypothetical protein